MPNHVTHRIVCTGTVSEVAAFKELMVVSKPQEAFEYIQDGKVKRIEATEEQELDFNRIIPRPPILEKILVPSKIGPNGRLMLVGDPIPGSIFSREDDREATVEEMEELKAAQPYTDWYNWSIDNWGTKWNSYGFEPVKDEARYEFKFDTAWAPPIPVFDAVTDRFPNLKFDVAWFDEGWCHAGLGVIGRDNPDASMGELMVDADDAIFERVYGEPPRQFDEDSFNPYSPFNSQDDYDRVKLNDTCHDVLNALDERGFFSVTSVTFSDDPVLCDDELYELRKTRDYILDKVSA
jgi:hypothetical protein